MPTGTPDSILLFDETPEYLDMTNEEQKKFFKEKMESFNKEQVQERVQLKIKRHKERMAGGLKPETQDPKTTHRNKRKNQWNLDTNNNNSKKEKEAVSEKKDKMQKTMSNDDNKKLSGKKVKYYSGAEKKKPEPPKPKPKFQEEGQTIRGSTKKNKENNAVLSYVEEEDDEINKNAKIQLEIKESNKKLKESMKKVTKYSVIKGYSMVKKKDMKPDNISRIGKIKFDRNILKDRQNKLNPALIKKDTTSAPLKKTNKEDVDKLNSANIISATDALKVLKWHEERLNNYVDIINKQQEFIDKLTDHFNFYSENYPSMFFNSKYSDLNTIKIHDKSIRMLQATWRYYTFRKALASIKVQRWFRYVKNVKNVSDEVQEFINNIAAVQKQTNDISKFLSSLDSKKALPLQRLKEIKQKLIKQQEVLDI